MAENCKLALLIDAENISPKYIKTIFDELSKYGVVTTKRIYGDWTRPGGASWKEIIAENALLPVQQFQNTASKNSSDSTLIIDAMDILYSKNIDGFCIVSSDSDFTRLITRIREDGKIVYGMGERKSPKSLINACDKFIYLDVNQKKEPKGAKKSPAKSGGRHIDLLSEIGKEKIDALITAATDSEEDWVYLADVGNRMTKLFPDFDQRNYGFKKLSDFIKALDIFDVKVEQSNKNGAKTYLIKLKDAKE
ncbi:MAG TPA: NYN domain-containing protein [Firmicutes bacterium]|nr:NYN domain-containing protein [Bacillota bacterium]